MLGKSLIKLAYVPMCLVLINCGSQHSGNTTYDSSNSSAGGVSDNTPAPTSPTDPAPTTPTTPTTPVQPTVTSQVAFQKTLYPIIQDNCADCHGQGQSPKFAVTNVKNSHDYLINQALVNLKSPSASRLVKKIEGGHKGFPKSVSEEMKVAITAWAAQLKTN